MATLLLPDGTQRDVQPASERGKFTLKEVQALVGGFVELVRLGRTNDDRRILLLDEDGKSKGLPANEQATNGNPATP
jgi:hypothetical protein